MVYQKTCKICSCDFVGNTSVTKPLLKVQRLERKLVHSSEWKCLTPYRVVI